jgi:hypothetical protein
MITRAGAGSSGHCSTRCSEPGRLAPQRRSGEMNRALSSPRADVPFGTAPSAVAVWATRDWYFHRQSASIPDFSRQNGSLYRQKARIREQIVLPNGFIAVLNQLLAGRRVAQRVQITPRSTCGTVISPRVGHLRSS